MKRKVLVVLFVMFAVKLFFSCQNEVTYGGNCGNPEKVFTGIITEVYEQSGAAYLEIEPDQHIVKEDFVISVSLKSESVVSINSNSIYKSLNLGFTSGYAFYDCVETFYTDPIYNVIIYAIDEVTEQKVIVTESFNIESYNKTTSIASFFEDTKGYLNNFILTLVDGGTIAGSTGFEIEVILESGSVLSSKTNVVNFTE